MTDVFMLFTFGVTVYVTYLVAENKGVGWGIGAFFACVVVTGMLMNYLGIESDGAACNRYSHYASEDC